MNTHSNTDYAWAAGFLDADGCFSLLRTTHGKHELTRQVNVSASQKSRVPLDRLADILGGRVRKGRSIYWQWALTGSDLVVAAIPLVLPYIVFKKDEAQAVLDFAQTIRRRGRGHTYTPDEAAVRMQSIAVIDMARGR